MSTELDTIINDTLFKSTTDGLTGTGKLVYSGSTLTWEADPVVPLEGYSGLESNSSQVIALTAVADVTASTGHITLNATGMWAETFSRNIVANATTSVFTITNSGIYKLSAWVEVSSDTIDTTFGVKFIVNGTSYSPATLVGTSKNVGDINNMAADSFVQFSAGDTLNLTIASDTTCNATFTSAGISLLKVDNV